MKTIYNLIKENLHNNPIIINSVLGKSHPWKRSHYVILSEIIQENLLVNEVLQNEKKFELGTSISHITLQRFFESDYDYKTHNDLRFLKTLDKLCIFLSFKNLNDFIQKVKEDKVFVESHFTKEMAVELVYKYCFLNFEFFKQFPDPKLNIFNDLVFSNSPLFERIKNYTTELKEIISSLITKNNRSNYEIFDIQVVSDEEDKIVIKTQEFWNCTFYLKDSDEEYKVNELSSQIYFVKKMDEVWKIWDNYNPNSGSISEKIKKSRL